MYLIALLISFAGMLVIDARFKLALWASPVPSGIALALGTVFFLLWDAAGIATGIFIRGDSPLLIGVDLAPHLPLEEPIFLAFLCHLALVAYAAALRWRAARAARVLARATGRTSTS